MVGIGNKVQLSPARAGAGAWTELGNRIWKRLHIATVAFSKKLPHSYCSFFYLLREGFKIKSIIFAEFSAKEVAPPPPFRRK